MNKGYIILIFITAVIAGYSLLHFTGNLTSVQSWFNGITGWFTGLTNNISGYLQGINTFIKENSWFAPAVGLCGTLGGITVTSWLKNRTQAKVVSSLQNDNMQVQNSITQTYSQSLTGLQSQNQTLQSQLLQAQQQLQNMPNISEMQSLIGQKEVEVRNLSGQIQLLQTTIAQLKPVQVPIYK